MVTFKGRETYIGEYNGNKYTVMPYLDRVRVDFSNGGTIISNIDACLRYLEPYIVQLLRPDRYKAIYHSKQVWKRGVLDIKDMLLYPHWGVSDPRPIAINNQYFKKYLGLPTIYPKIKGVYVDSNGKKHTEYEL